MASRLFTQPFVQAQIKETSKLRVTGLREGNSRVIGDAMSQQTISYHFQYIYMK